MWSARMEDIGARFVSTEDVEELPGEPYVLHPNYPNPFTDATTLPFSIRGTADVRMEIYDLLGRKVDVLTDQTYAAGTHRVQWNANGQASGVYFARMSVNGKAVSVQKVVRR